MSLANTMADSEIVAQTREILMFFLFFHLRQQQQERPNTTATTTYFHTAAAFLDRKLTPHCYLSSGDKIRYQVVVVGVTSSKKPKAQLH